MFGDRSSCSIDALVAFAASFAQSPREKLEISEKFRRASTRSRKEFKSLESSYCNGWFSFEIFDTEEADELDVIFLYYYYLFIL